MNVADLLTDMPFVSHLGVEVVEAADGRARGRLDLEPEHSSNPATPIAHGGVTYALADTVGGAAVITEAATVCPTIDMRIDYLAPARTDLEATGEVRKLGESSGVADVTVTDAEGTEVATARGVYKLGGGGPDSPWTAGRSLAGVEAISDLGSGEDQ